MSISVQTATGAVWPRREAATVRPAAEREEPTAVDRTAAADPQDYATDALRLAALRRDAAATAAAATPKATTAVDDKLIAGLPQPGSRPRAKPSPPPGHFRLRPARMRITVRPTCPTSQWCDRAGAFEVIAGGA